MTKEIYILTLIDAIQSKRRELDEAEVNLAQEYRLIMSQKENEKVKPIEEQEKKVKKE